MTPPPVIAVEALPGPPIARRRVELVERKGLGHPDTICDSLVETIALALNRMYVERLGAVAGHLHAEPLSSQPDGEGLDERVLVLDDEDRGDWGGHGRVNRPGWRRRPVRTGRPGVGG